jgi:hypothetical protein
MITESFAAIYETVFGIFNQNYSLIFSTLYDYGGYLKIGFLFLLIPLLLWLLFYYVWRFPYGKFWHWGLWLIICGIVVFVSTWSLSNLQIFASSNQQLIDALNDPQSGYSQYAAGLPVTYATINIFLSIIVSFILSLIMKQFSKIQIHLPF